VDATAALADDIAALRTAAGACAPDVRAVLGVTGADHRAWLERIASNPVADLADGGLARVTLMDGKGRMRADVVVLAVPDRDGVMLDVPASHRPALLRLLDMYVIQDDVQITDLGEAFRFVSLMGPGHGDVATACGVDVPGPESLKPLDGGGWALPHRLSGLPGVDLLVPIGDVEAWLDRLSGAGAARVAPAALDVVRIGNGVPWFGPDLSTDVIPLEAHLDDWVSITKGCYPGQEVVARITNLGQVARKLVGLAAPGHANVEPGELHGTGEQADKAAGSVTSVAYDPCDDVTLALGYARRAFWKDGTGVRAGDVTFTVRSLG
jgi:folate-binding protein YgfZ